ncbi:MAG: argininosuccinate lyase, partial [Acidimicrobiia bacterium]|nr:argininosuccinate lyase [Acidimicrobiia bacterium]
MSDDSSTLWHGRFEGGPSEALMAYTASLPFDRQLWRDDIAGSRAHVRGLWRADLLDDAERDTILDALDGVENELASDVFRFASGDEDIHTAVERR